MKVVRKVDKVPIAGLQIGIGRTTYMQKSNLMYRHVENFNAANFLDLKKRYILPGLLCSCRKLA